jgi:hypothetical protein
MVEYARKISNFCLRIGLDYVLVGNPPMARNSASLVNAQCVDIPIGTEPQHMTDIIFLFYGCILICFSFGNIDN